MSEVEDTHRGHRLQLRIPRPASGTHPPAQAAKQQQLALASPPCDVQTEPVPEPQAKRQKQQHQPICCAEEVLDLLPPHVLQRIEKLPPDANPGDLIKELHAALGGSLRMITPPGWRQLHQQQVQQQHGRGHGSAWQVPLLSSPSLFDPHATAASAALPQPQRSLLLLHVAPQHAVGSSSTGAGALGDGDGLQFHLSLMQQLDAVGWESVVGASKVGVEGLHVPRRWRMLAIVFGTSPGFFHLDAQPNCCSSCNTPCCHTTLCCTLSSIALHALLHAVLQCTQSQH